MENACCVVCHKKSTLFHYGVQSCNACTMFFRRVTAGGRQIHECEHQGICYKDPVIDKSKMGCRMCRFKKCIDSGMINPATTNLEIQVSDKIQLLLKELVHCDARRNDLLMNYIILENPIMERVAEIPNQIAFYQQPKNVKRSLPDWLFINTISTLDFIKKFQFVHQLNNEDRIIYLKFTHAVFTVFSLGFKSISYKTLDIMNPDSSDILPTEFSTKHRSDIIKNRLVAKLVEMKLTYKEFLLIQVLFLCNPAIPNLSQDGSLILRSHQEMYCSMLVKYCFSTHQQSGPSRFVELLSLYQFVTNINDDMAQYFLLVQYQTLPYKIFYQ